MSERSCGTARPTKGTMMKRMLLLIAAAALFATGTASAGGTHHPKKRHHHHPKPPPVVVVPPAKPPVPPVVVPPVVPQPAAVSYCVSSNKGVTYVQLTANAFAPGTYWRGLYDSGATVVIAGQSVMFVNKGEAGIYLAPLVPGVGSTCP